MLARFRVAALAAGLLSLSLVTSCGGSDSTSPKQASLSAEDTQAFVVALDEVIQDLMDQTNSFGTSSNRSPKAASFAVTTQNLSGSATTQCPKGGDARSVYSGTSSSDDQTNKSSATATAQLTFASCRIATNTRQFTVNGEIDVGIALAVTADPFTFDKFLISYEGSLSWDGNTCPINVSIDLTPNGSGAKGSVCGTAVTNGR